MLPLRARNRRAAMRAVQTTALELFEARGFDAVTIEEVAEAAGVSVSTVYRHFKTKEQLVLWDEVDASIEAALGRELGRSAPLAALGAAFSAGYAELDESQLALLRRRTALIDATPQVHAAMLASFERDRIELTDALHRLSRGRRAPLELELIVRTALACLIAALEAWQRAGAEERPSDFITRTFAAARRIDS